MVENKFEQCPMFGDYCRFCSKETSRHPFTKLKKVNGVFAPDSHGFSIHQLGAYCNNYCEWVEKMHHCPVKWQNMKSQKWKLRKNTDTELRQEIVQIWQQKLIF